MGGGQIAPLLEGVGSGNAVIFDEASVTYEAVAAAVNAGKAVHLWKTDGNGDKVLMTLVRPPLADNSMTSYYFASAIYPENAGDDLTVYTSSLRQDNSLTFKADVCTTTDYFGRVVETIEANVEEAITTATNEVKLAVIMFSENKLYLMDAAAETQIELTFDVLTQLAIARPIIVLDFVNGTVYTFNKAGLDGSSIVFSRTDGNTTSIITMAADNTITVAENEIAGGSGDKWEYIGAQTVTDADVAGLVFDTFADGTPLKLKSAYIIEDVYPALMEGSSPGTGFAVQFDKTKVYSGEVF